MITFIKKRRISLLEIASNLLLLEIILISLHYLTSIIVSVWIDMDLLIAATVACVFLWLFIYIQKDENYYKEITQPHIEEIFLFILLLVVFSGLNLDIIKENQFLSLIVSLISSVQLYLIVLLICLGFFIFYFKIASFSTKAEPDMESVEIPAKRKIEGLNNLSFSFMNNGNLLHYLFLFLIVSLFFITRLYDTNFINGSDNYNLLGIKNMYENGVSVYKYSSTTDFLMLKIVTYFGFNTLTIKIPFLFYSFITLIFVYLSSNLINRNLALISSLLYVISPWAIIQARMTRDYSFDLMAASIVIYLCFVIYKKINEARNIKEVVVYLFLFSFIPLATLYVYHNIRSQTLVVGIYAMFTALFICNYLLYAVIAEGKFSKISALTKLRGHIGSLNFVYWVIVCSTLLVAVFYIEKFPFVFGFKDPDFVYFDYFFNPAADSPWQWFHGLNIVSALFYGLFLLGLFSFDSGKMPGKYLQILFSSLLFGLLLYSFKYQTHLEYIPVRYVYFLFLPYIIIFANSLLNVVTLFNARREQIVLIAALIFLINPIPLLYSVSPILAYENEGISNVQIDNTGIGQFNLLGVVGYLEKMGVDNNDIIVLDGRYEELILYLDRPMDKDRKLVRYDLGNTLYYDISEKTYVQSVYFGYAELKEAVSTNEKGIYVTSDKVILSEDGDEEMKLQSKDFELYDVSFSHLNTINGYQIYSWDTS